MKNADRINFYIAGLRQPPANTGAQPEAAAAPATLHESTRPAETPVLPAPGTAATKAKSQAVSRPIPAAIMPDLQSSLTLHSTLPLTAGSQQVAGADQAQLHRLLLQLNAGRDRSGDRQAPSPEAARKRQRQLVIGLVLAGMIIAAQASAVIWLYQRAELLLGRPLSPALLLTAAAGDLNVTFRTSASAGDVAVLLRELDLRVVEGPDAASRYVLRPEIGADSNRILNALRDRRDLVYSADPTY